MDQFKLTENVDILFHSLENFTQREGVIGKPVTQGDKTFLPIVSLTVGYGGGNASMGSKGNNTTSTTNTSESGTGALGLGAKLNTEAIVVIDKQNVSMMTMNNPTSQLMDKIPQMISNMTSQGNQASQTTNQPTQPTK